jgi:guanine nucleotide-binding protein subunit alpha
LKESIDLFGTLISSQWFRKSSFILFLNKIDILESKLKTSDLSKYFPDYDGAKEDLKEARRFIFRMFEDAIEDNDRLVYSHYTCVTSMVPESEFD